MLAYGRWEPLVLCDPGPARARLEELMSAYGLGVESCAELVGLSSSIIAGLVLERGRGRRTRGVYPRTERRILDARFDLDRLGAGRRVSAAGTRRRIEALAWMGWSGEQVARALGVSRSAVAAHRHREVVLVATARAVRDLYERWSMLAGPSPRAAAAARRRGFAPPLAWEGEDLDDVRAAPHRFVEGVAVEDVAGEVFDEVAVERVCAGLLGAEGLSGAEREEAFARLAAAGVSDPQIAVRLGWSTRTSLRRRQGAGIGSRWAS